jgi:PAS domain S-box-containing protein
MKDDANKTKEQLIFELADLRKNYDKLFSLFEMIPVGLVVTDDSGNITKANSAAKNIFGFVGDNAYGPWENYSLHHMDGSVFPAQHLPLTKSLINKQAYSGVNMLVHKANKVVITNVSSSPVYNKNGDFIGAVAVIEDITAKAKLQQEKDVLFREMLTKNALLQKEQSQTEAILNSLPVGVFIVDKTGAFAKISKNVEDIWGKNAPRCQSVLEYQLYQGWWANTGKHLKAEDWAVARALRHGEISKGEVIDILRFDGTKGTILNSAAPIKDKNDNITGAVVVVEDITYQRQLEKELRQHRTDLEKLVQQKTDELKAAEYRFYASFESITVGLVFINTEGKIIRANPAFIKLLGYSDEELLVMSLVNITYPEDLAVTREMINKISQSEISQYQLEKRYLTKGGKVVWAHVVVSGCYDAKNKLQFLTAVVEDITEKKKHQQEIARLDSLNLVGQMAASISHEVRNPMTTVRGFLQLLGSKKEYEADKNFFNLMISELDRANAIITEFLAIGKDRPAELKWQNLNRIIGAIAPLLQADALRADKYMEFQLQKVPDLRLDGKEIRQVILNLVRNGLEAMASNGKITISTRLAADKVILVVQDQGCGIPADVQPKLGTPFFTTKESGTGLGLATCYSIVKRHNGIIAVDTSAKGTTFSISFPIN